MRKARELPTETHQSIDQQVAAFLKSGKQIQKIPHGVTGEPVKIIKMTFYTSFQSPGAKRKIFPQPAISISRFVRLPTQEASPPRPRQYGP